MDRPGKVATPARDQLIREHDFSHCLRLRLGICSRETGSAVPSRVSLLILHTQVESCAYSRASSHFPRRRPQITPSAIGSVSSLSGHTFAYRWHSLPRVHWHRANSPQGNSSNGCCLFRYCNTMDQLLIASLFPYSTIIITIGNMW